MFPFFKTEEMKYLESQTPGQHVIHNIYNEYHNDVTNILSLISDYFGKNTKFCKNIRELFVIHCMRIDPMRRPNILCIYETFIDFLANESQEILTQYERNITIRFMQLKIAEYIYEKYGENK